MYTLYIDTHSDKINLVLYQDSKVLINKDILAEQNRSITTMPILIDILNGAKIEVQK